MITFHPLQTLRYIHNRNMMEKELNNILNRWLMRISETGSFDPHQHKEDYLQITEYICTCNRETLRNVLRTVRDFSLKPDCDVAILKELVIDLLKVL